MLHLQLSDSKCREMLHHKHQLLLLLTLCVQGIQQCVSQQPNLVGCHQMESKRSPFFQFQITLFMSEKQSLKS